MPKTVTVGHAICPACKQRIIWASTDTTEKIPLDWPSDPAGTLVAEPTAPGGFTGTRAYVPGEVLFPPSKRYGDHRETCPDRPSTGEQVWWTAEEPELDPSFAEQLALRGKHRRQQGRRRSIPGIRWRPRS